MTKDLKAALDKLMHKAAEGAAMMMGHGCSDLKPHARALHKAIIEMRRALTDAKPEKPKRADGKCFECRGVGTVQGFDCDDCHGTGVPKREG